MKVLHNWLNELVNQPPGLNTLNPSNFNALSMSVVFASVATMSLSTHDDHGEVQRKLAIWAGATIKRLKLLLPQMQCHSLPLIGIYGRVWMFYLARERHGSIVSEISLNDIKGYLRRQEIAEFSRPIGSTASLNEMYMLIASLRKIIDWGHKSFEPWFNRIRLS